MHVAPRLVDFHFRKDDLDNAFDQLAEAEDLTDDGQDFVDAKATETRTFFANPDRVSAICADIIEHLYTTIDPLGMKAQVMVYDEMTRQLALRAGDSPPVEAAVVMSVAS